MRASAIQLAPALVGAALAVAAISWGASDRAWVAEAARADGVVTKLNAGGSHPEIEFTSADGERVAYPQGGWIFGFEPGDHVTVLYDARSPADDPEIDRLGALYAFPLGLGVLAASFLGVALAGFWFPLRIRGLA